MENQKDLMSEELFNTPNQDNNSEIETNNEKKINVLKNLKFIYIIKSYFCCRGRKMKLINLCDNAVNKDICVERLLKRIYLMENKLNIMINVDYLQINNIIDSIIDKPYRKANDKSEDITNIYNEVK